MGSRGAVDIVLAWQTSDHEFESH